MAETLVYKGSLVGHSGAVTAIATSPELPDAIVTASRDRKLILWSLTRDEVRTRLAACLARLGTDKRTV